ncbi:hypothetical protein BKA63DRAFT_559126 [Paraphoma chrysanthemicola]|nr:hypothetical protein BKA63DRAFT_559126 [Paraphoma chrysanthemicola]
MASPATDAALSSSTGGNGRVQPNASSTDHVLEYGEFTIILPKELAPYHTFLIARQKYAIDQGAVYDVTQSTLVCSLAWTLEDDRRTCAHVNLSPVQRDKVPYESNDHVALFLKDGLVVAGVFLCSISRLRIARIAHHLEDPGWYGFFACLRRNELKIRHSKLKVSLSKTEHDLKAIELNFADDLQAMTAMTTSTTLQIASALPSPTNLVGDRKRKRRDSEATFQQAAQRRKDEEAVLTHPNAGLGEESHSGAGDTSWQANESVSYMTEFLVPNTLSPTTGSTTHLDGRPVTTSAQPATISIQHYQTPPQEELQEDNTESKAVGFTLDEICSSSNFSIFMPPSTAEFDELIDRWSLQALQSKTLDNFQHGELCTGWPS